MAAAYGGAASVAASDGTGGAARVSGLRTGLGGVWYAPQKHGVEGTMAAWGVSMAARFGNACS